MYRAMIVDDYEVFRNVIKTSDVWGDVSGFVISGEAANGKDALRKLQQEPVDLLLTDIRMPYLDGIELTKKVHEQKLCPCIVLMSQFSEFDYARQGLSNGALDYLLKPVVRDELLRVLLRAAELIRERRLEISKINYLEKLLNKSTEEYFPTEELSNLLDAISTCGPQSLSVASYLVDITFSEFNFECIKTAYVLQTVMKNLAEAIPIEYPWLNKFANLQELKVIDFSMYSEISVLKEAFLQKIDSLLLLIRKFEMGIDNSNMVRKACKLILENIDTDISVNEISNKLFITRTYLSQIFKEKTGINLIKYLTDVKIERAKVLIANGSKYYEISEILGYKGDEYFKKLFKKSTGMTINEYKLSIT